MCVLLTAEVKPGKFEARSVVNDRTKEWLSSDMAKEWRAEREKLWGTAEVDETS